MHSTVERPEGTPTSDRTKQHGGLNCGQDYRQPWYNKNVHKVHLDINIFIMLNVNTKKLGSSEINCS